ncbi:hypothetical protein A4A49_12569 [Nicotiana attenuata]|uniref:Uncharacterized protein n=1 Tax=Nicotiana attenuata TaxID=49451 RepID=A0A1J6IAE2_NICAT|nr:hypothetical protein A4A49_12569 [Nicotiana attenuata]
MQKMRYQLITVNTSGMNDGCKWGETFEDVGVVVFCVVMSDNDQILLAPEDTGSGTLLQSRLCISKNSSLVEWYTTSE